MRAELMAYAGFQSYAISGSIKEEFFVEFGFDLFVSEFVVTGDLEVEQQWQRRFGWDFFAIEELPWYPEHEVPWI